MSLDEFGIDYLDSTTERILTTTFEKKPQKGLAFEINKSNDQAKSSVELSELERSRSPSPLRLRRSQRKAVVEATKESSKRQGRRKIVKNPRRSKREKQVLSQLTKMKVKDQLMHVEDMSEESEDNEDEDMMLKIKWETEIVKLRVLRTEKFSRILERFAASINRKPEEITLFVNDHAIHHDQSVLGLNLDVSTFVIANLSEFSCSKSEKIVGNLIEVKIQSMDKGSKTVMKIEKNEPMKSVISRYRAEKPDLCKGKKVKLFLDGEIRSEDTAETLDLEGGECLDAEIS